MNDLSPQNPYRSFVVSASAGSGKTYQLSRRFLNLVGAGADPQSILTITFTVKAAAEMRERILRDAGEMLRRPDEAAAFDARLMDFFTSADAAHRRQFGRALKPPRSAHEVAHSVLAGTQLLKIATIDSVFASWVRKFPWEAAGSEGVERAHFPILSGVDRKELHAAAWQVAARHMDESGLLASLPGLTFLDVGRRLEALASHRSYLWYAGVLKERSGFLEHGCAGPLWDNEAACLSAFKSELAALVAAMPNAEKRALAEEALGRLELEGLRVAGLITRDGGVSGNTIKGEKKRAALAREIAAVEEALLRFQDGVKLRQLNHLTRCFRQLHDVYQGAREAEKVHLERGEFDDILRGVFHLFQSSDAAGARYLLHKQIRHVMLDEFQDTSSLQWAVFHNIAAEMLAGCGEAENVQPQPSVFLVGDEKQSIYGFREADPAVIQHASLDLADHGVVTVPMSRSYRTTQIVLDVVNATFADLMPDFPAHVTALGEGENPVIPACGGVWLSPKFGGESEEAARAAEAHAVAQFIAEAVGSESFAVHERRDGVSTFRPLRAGDCAILYRNSTHAERYEEALRQEGFAVVAEIGKGFFERPEILDAIALLTWLGCPFDVCALATVLKSPFFCVADADLLQALEEMKDQQLDRVRLILDVLRAKYSEAVATLEAWRRDALTQPPHRLLNRALRRRASALAGEANEQEARLMRANLDLFMERVVAFEAAGDGDIIPLLEKLRALAAEEKVSGANVSTDAVHLMTIHKAKGLEFPLVVLVDTATPWERADPFWSKSHDPENPGLYYVGTADDRPKADLAFAAVRAALEKEARSENERLLYVAMTRASQYLLVTGYEGRSSKEAQQPFYSHLEKVMTSCAAVMDEQAVGWRCLRDPIPAGRMREDEPVPLVAAPCPASFKPSPAIVILPPSRTLEAPDEGERPAVNASAARRRFATEIGILIHKGLEIAAGGAACDLSKYWEKLVYPQPTEGLAVDAFQEAARELDEVQQDPNWRELLAAASAVHPEMAFIHLHGDQLVRGSIDLCVERKDGKVLVIDYKTTMVGNDETAPLEQLARDKGYFSQLALYVSAVRALYPGREVMGAIYFTACRRSVWL